MRGIDPRVFRAACGLLVAAQLALQIASVRLETQTWDEGIHLSAGLSYWKTGDYRLNFEHPAFPKLMCALPLLFTATTVPVDDRSWAERDEIGFGRKFLYENKLPADDILFRARMATILLSALLTCFAAWWVRLRFGDWPALLAAAMLAFDPNALAHGRYVTTDLWAAAFSFAACVLWHEALVRRRAAWFALAGVALGLAVGSKYSTFFAIVSFVVLGAIRRPTARGAAVMLAAAAGALCAIYAPEAISASRAALTGKPIAAPFLAEPLAQTADNGTFVGERLHHAGQALNLPSFAYLRGVARVAEHVKGGHWGYLLGQTSLDGWWYYFPVAFAVKTPAATLLLAAALLGVLAWKRPKPSFAVLALLVPFAACWAFAIASRLNIGLRHILPVYPFLYAMLAVGATKYLPRGAAWAAVAVLVAESLFIYPHYLAFFNVFAGGPGNGPRILIDSNIDWGQDTKKLRAWLDERGWTDTPVCTAYFGQAYPPTYGINELYLPRADEPEKIAAMDCLAAASATLLMGGYTKDDPWRYLREREPMAKIGYSIYVYDYRK